METFIKRQTKKTKQKRKKMTRRKKGRHIDRLIGQEKKKKQDLADITTGKQKRVKHTNITYFWTKNGTRAE